MGNAGSNQAFTTPSGIEVRAVYDPADADFDPSVDLGAPGAFPFTRGVYPDMYRGRRWTMRQYAGFGTAEETNARFRYLLDQGQTGLSVAFDLPTQMGLDSDDPRAEGEVGRVGVAIDTIDDMEVLFDRIPLGSVSTSMTINATAAVLLSMYVAVADARGIPRSDLSGTVQNDILKEFVARGTYIYPVEPSLRLVTDIFEFCAAEVPRWNSISISGYHMREAGCTAVQEIAFTLGNARQYVRGALARGLDLEGFAPRLSFFFAAHNDLFEEVAKFRAARRLWARMMRDEFGGSDRSARLRFHTQTGGSTLTAQQPENNIVRVAVQALAAVLGGTQSLHTNGYDEALSLPTEAAAKLALRTQQIVAEESGAASTADPLGGSWYVESLTDELETKARHYLERIDELGDVARAIPFMSEEIHQAAYRWQLELEGGERRVVGVNCYEEPTDPPRLEQPDFARLGREQAARLARVRADRDDGAVTSALRQVDETAGTSENLVPVIVAAVKARATIGEISGVLRDRWGTFQA
ncbi:MAG: methylmalonyl-CoA mutase family protein [marine benthic group bacterium]|nr:methylmalonyl-CoA mutase family protein [Candidatus Carthagonibacter metallireducens]